MELHSLNAMQYILLLVYGQCSEVGANFSDDRKLNYFLE